MPFATTYPRSGQQDGPSVGVEEQIRTWVSRAFPAVQAAWSNSDIEGLRPYVSQPLAEQMALDLSELEREGLVNRVEDPQLQEVTLLPSTDQWAVEISFTARDWLGDARTGAIVEGDHESIASFRQHWHLLRRGRDGWLVDAVIPSAAAED
jgi:predicted lipid-binding transport protein (Tim44 family)